MRPLKIKPKASVYFCEGLPSPQGVGRRKTRRKWRRRTWTKGELSEKEPVKEQIKRLK